MNRKVAITPEHVTEKYYLTCNMAHDTSLFHATRAMLHLSEGAA